MYVVFTSWIGSLWIDYPHKTWYLIFHLPDFEVFEKSNTILPLYIISGLIILSYLRYYRRISPNFANSLVENYISLVTGRSKCDQESPGWGNPAVPVLFSSRQTPSSIKFKYISIFEFIFQIYLITLQLTKFAVVRSFSSFYAK